jgi:hypothetical protein
MDPSLHEFYAYYTITKHCNTSADAPDRLHSKFTYVNMCQFQ